MRYLWNEHLVVWVHGCSVVQVDVNNSRKDNYSSRKWRREENAVKLETLFSLNPALPLTVVALSRIFNPGGVFLSLDVPFISVNIITDAFFSLHLTHFHQKWESARLLANRRAATGSPRLRFSNSRDRFISGKFGAMPDSSASPPSQHPCKASESLPCFTVGTADPCWRRRKPLRFIYVAQIERHKICQSYTQSAQIFSCCSQKKVYLGLLEVMINRPDVLLSAVDGERSLKMGCLKPQRLVFNERCNSSAQKVLPLDPIKRIIRRSMVLFLWNFTFP